MGFLLQRCSLLTYPWTVFFSPLYPSFFSNCFKFRLLSQITSSLSKYILHRAMLSLSPGVPNLFISCMHHFSTPSFFLNFIWLFDYLIVKLLLYYIRVFIILLSCSTTKYFLLLGDVGFFLLVFFFFSLHNVPFLNHFLPVTEKCLLLSYHTMSCHLAHVWAPVPPLEL